LRPVDRRLGNALVSGRFARHQQPNRFWHRGLWLLVHAGTYDVFGVLELRCGCLVVLNVVGELASANLAILRW
jgi:hypothetical protein